MSQSDDDINAQVLQQYTEEEYNELEKQLLQIFAGKNYYLVNAALLCLLVNGIAESYKVPLDQARLVAISTLCNVQFDMKEQGSC